MKLNKIVLVSTLLLPLLYSGCAPKENVSVVLQKKNETASIKHAIDLEKYDELVYTLKHAKKTDEFIEVKNKTKNKIKRSGQLEFEKLHFTKRMHKWGSNSMNSGYFSDTMLLTAIVYENLPLIKNLVNGVQPAEINQFIATHPPLILAASRSLEITKFLVENGADITILDTNLNDALYHAKKYKKKDIVDYLISKGAGVEKIQKKAKKPSTELLKLRESIHVKSKTFEEFKILVDKGIDVNARLEQEGYTSLMLYGTFIPGSVSLDRSSVYKKMKYLIENGARTDIKDSNGNTIYDKYMPKHVYTHKKVKEFLRRYDINK